MIIGVPKETKAFEYRVALVPEGARVLVVEGHQVLIERGAGLGSGFSDEAYQEAGARLVEQDQIYAQSDMIVKVKEPQAHEWNLYRPGQILFAYLHLAPDPQLTQALLERSIVAFAYETVQLKDGSLPLLKPMSEIAGRMAVQIGARLMEKTFGGIGQLMGGIPGVEPVKVVVLGAGHVGRHAIDMALGMGAQVCAMDINQDPLDRLKEKYGDHLKTILSNPMSLMQMSSWVDLLIAAVLVPGCRAPTLITREMVVSMRPGTVLVDVAIDQGGVVETMDRITTHQEPTYLREGVIHCAVANLPGAVPRTSTLALTNATLPYVRDLARLGWRKSVETRADLARGLNLREGQVTCPGVAKAQGLPLADSING